MSKKFQKLAQEIKVLEASIQREKNRLVETDDRIGKNREDLKAIEEQLPDAVFSGDESVIRNLEKNRDNLRKALERDQTLIHGVHGYLAKAEKEIAKLRKDRDGLFETLVGEWLQMEVAKYDEIARGLIEKIKRLLAGQALLGEIGGRQSYRQRVGAGYEALVRQRIVILNGFNLTTFNDSANNRPGPKIIEAVKGEILGGGK